MGDGVCDFRRRRFSWSDSRSCGRGGDAKRVPAGLYRSACQLSVAAELPTRFGPELLGPLEPVVQQFDRRFDMARRDGKSLLAVLRIVHSRLLVLQIGQCFADDPPDAGRDIGFAGRANILLTQCQFGDHP